MGVRDSGRAGGPEGWEFAAPETNEPLDWSEVRIRPAPGKWQLQQAVRESHGWKRVNRRLRTQPVGGAVCVAATDEEEPRVLLVRQERPAPGIWVWEAPRGGGEGSDQGIEQTALRELREETGVRAEDPVFIGYQYPDTGTLADRVAVVLARVPQGAMSELAGSRETEEARFFTTAEIRRMVVRGTVRDSLTLGALLMAHEWGAAG